MAATTISQPTCSTCTRPAWTAPAYRWTTQAKPGTTATPDAPPCSKLEFPPQICQCRGDVVVHHGRDHIAFTLRPQLKHGQVFLVRPVLAAGGLQMLAHISFGNDIEALDHLDGQRTAKRPHQRHVEIAIEAAHHVLVRDHRFVERIQRALGRGLVLRRGQPARLAYGIGFQFQAQRVDLFRLFRAQGPHEVAAIGMGYQQAFLLKARQGFPQGDFAHAQFGGQRVLADGSVRRNPAGDDALAYQREDLFGECSDYKTHVPATMRIKYTNYTHKKNPAASRKKTAGSSATLI